VIGKLELAHEGDILSGEFQHCFHRLCRLGTLNTDKAAAIVKIELDIEILLVFYSL